MISDVRPACVGFPDAKDLQDYYVFMTYDLHGQWDWNNTFVK